MLARHRFTLTSVFCASAALILTGCGAGKPNYGIPPCTFFGPFEPAMQLIYPIPGATNVPTNIGVIVYSSSESLPITLSTGGAAVSEQATAVPSPLPSPAATPIPLPSNVPSPGPTPISGEALYAVGVSALTAGTTYTVANTIDVPNCGSNGTTYFTPRANVDGTFTTAR